MIIQTIKKTIIKSIKIIKITRKKRIIIISIIAFLVPTQLSYQKNVNSSKNIFFSKNTYRIKKNNNSKERILLKINIPKINLLKNIYEVNSYLNQVDKNVTILPESKLEQKGIILAAHSGNNSNAYFNNISSLNKNDLIYITLQNNTYVYEVKNIYYINKTGYMEIPEELSNALILITCSVKYKNKQLIVVSTLIDNKQVFAMKKYL